MGSNPKTNISGQQVLQKVYDEANDRLRVDAVVTATIGDVKIDAEESDIAIKDRVTDNLLKINTDGSIDANVVVSASSGDSIKISDGIDELAINADGSLNAQVAGVSTAANQTTQITSLNSIDTKLNTLGQKPKSGSVPVVLASDTDTIPVQDQPATTQYYHDKILSADDLLETYSWLSFGTKNERLSQLNFTSASVASNKVLRKTFSYTFISGAYRLDTVTWSVITI